MTTTEQNPARSEYFGQLIEKIICKAFNDARLKNKSEMIPGGVSGHKKTFVYPDPKLWLKLQSDSKERILSITYDANVALQKENNDYENAVGQLKVERAALYKRVEELEAVIKEIFECQQDPSKTLANLNGVIRNAKSIVNK